MSSIPPLRERLDDLAVLIDVLMAGFDPRIDVAADGVAELAKHHWPGNVRELRKLPRELAASSDSKVAGARDVRDYALRALELTGDRVGEAAEMMGVSRHTLRRLRDGEDGT